MAFAFISFASVDALQQIESARKVDVPSDGKYFLLKGLDFN